ncbi:MAG: hypothetical protein ABIH83_02370 [Candidatus Micrarchaeota archaeon]
MAKSNIPSLIIFGLFFSLLLSFAGCFNGEDPPEPPPYNPNASLNQSLYPVDPSVYNGQANLTPPEPIEISFIDVGYGDATLIRSEGKVILFDAGPDKNADKVISHLRRKGITEIDLLILSSNDALFVNGAPAVIRSFDVKEVWVNGGEFNDENWQEILELAETSEVNAVEYAHTYEEGNFTLTVLNPFPGLRNPNPAMDSIVLKAEYDDFCAVLFSNSEASGAASSDPGTVFGGVDNRIISGPISIKGCQVLKISHHASGNAASFQLLDNMDPEIAVISVGRNPPQNLYPEPTTIRRLLLREIDIYTTDWLGIITVSSGGTGYTVETEKERHTVYLQFLNQVGYYGMAYYN